MEGEVLPILGIHSLLFLSFLSLVFLVPFFPFLGSFSLAQFSHLLPWPSQVTFITMGIFSSCALAVWKHISYGGGAFLRNVMGLFPSAGNLGCQWFLANGWILFLPSLPVGIKINICLKCQEFWFYRIPDISGCMKMVCGQRQYSSSDLTLHTWRLRKEGVLASTPFSCVFPLISVNLNRVNTGRSPRMSFDIYVKYKMLILHSRTYVTSISICY